MTFWKSSWPDNSFITVFLDANILAKPLTRTLILLAGLPSQFIPAWSAHAEEQASRHRRPGATPLSEVRDRLGYRHSPSGRDPQRFIHTAEEDRQILADAVAAEASFLITENIKDFGLHDLGQCEISASRADLFMSMRVTTDAYGEVLRFLERSRSRPALSVPDIHVLLAQHHPRLVNRFSARVGPVAPLDTQASSHFRGARCLRCLRPRLSGSSQFIGRCEGPASIHCRRVTGVKAN